MSAVSEAAFLRKVVSRKVLANQSLDLRRRLLLQTVFLTSSVVLPRDGGGGVSCHLLLLLLLFCLFSLCEHLLKRARLGLLLVEILQEREVLLEGKRKRGRGKGERAKHKSHQTEHKRASSQRGGTNTRREESGRIKAETRVNRCRILNTMGRKAAAKQRRSKAELAHTHTHLILCDGPLELILLPLLLRSGHLLIERPFHLKINDCDI